MGWTKLPSEALLGLARVSGAGTGRVVRVSREAAGWLRSAVGFSRDELPKRAPSLEEAIRRSLLAEIADGQTALSSGDVEPLVAKIAALLRKVLAGDLSLDAIPPLTSLLRPSRLSTAQPLQRTEPSGNTAEKQDILRRILQENLELRALLKPDEESQ